MDVEPPLRPADQNRPGLQRRRALWLAGAGVLPGLAAVICSTLGAISVQQTIALALPAAVLIIGGLAAAAVDTQTFRRSFLQAGFKVGSLLGRWRSVDSRQDSTQSQLREPGSPGTD